VKQIPTNALRRQLAQNRPAGPHPDADLLTAFAEDSLLDRERTEVLAHLAGCASCRAILHTSTGGVPEPTPLPQPKPDRVPLRALIPGVVILACLFVMATSTILFYRASRGHVPGAQTATGTRPALPAAAAAPSLASAPTPQATPTPPQSPPSSGATPKHIRTARPRPPAPAPLPPTNESEVGTQAPSAAPEGAISGLSLNAAASRNAPTSVVGPQDKMQTQAQDKAQMQAQLQAEMVARHGTALAAKARPEATAPAAFAPMNTFTREPRQKAAVISGLMTQPAPARLRINDSGHIERAIAPETWQRVPVGEQVRFRVLLESGQEIWAGGDQLRLYHSADNGATWTAIQLPPRVDRSHAIVHIRLEPRGRVTIEADDGTTWITTDGGQTWQ
jgi:hypothetical protein